MNEMTLESEFDKLVSAHLASLANRFDSELVAILDDEPPENVTVIFIEYDSPHFADDFAVMIHFLSARYDAEDSDGFLAGETVVPVTAYEDDKYEALEPWGRASDILVGWLVDRWKHCATYPLPAYAGHHDSNYCTRLSDGKEMLWDHVTF